MAEKVDDRSDARAVGENPHGPHVKVTDGLALERGAADPVAQPANVALDLDARDVDAGVVGDTLGAAAIQVLGPGPDAEHAVGEGGTEDVGGCDEGVDLLSKRVAAGAGPETTRIGSWYQWRPGIPRSDQLSCRTESMCV